MNETENTEWNTTGETLIKKEPPDFLLTTEKKIVGIYGLQNKLKLNKWYIGQSNNIQKRF